MDEGLKLSQERIKRFERLGGVDLRRLEPEEQGILREHIHVGYANYKNAVFTFQCPTCGKRERSDQEMAPCCTGPAWTDDHPLEVMTLVP